MTLQIKRVRIDSPEDAPEGFISLIKVKLKGDEALAQRAGYMARMGTLASAQVSGSDRGLVFVNPDNMKANASIPDLGDMQARLQAIRAGTYDHKTFGLPPKAEVKTAIEPLVTVPRAFLESLQRSVDANTAALARLESIWAPSPTAAAPTLALVA